MVKIGPPADALDAFGLVADVALPLPAGSAPDMRALLLCLVGMIAGFCRHVSACGSLVDGNGQIRELWDVVF